MNSKYRVSAIVSAYNSERFLQGCLEDLVGQTLFQRNELEVIVVNTGSQQGEDVVVSELQRKHPQIVSIRIGQRETIYQAWNRGIRAASGEYVTNANTDDRHRADALEVMAAELDAHPEVALVYGDMFVTNFENQTLDSHIRSGYHVRPDFSPDIMLSGCHMGPQPMWRRQAWEEIGGFREDLKSAGDYEYWCRIALRHPMRHIREFLGLYYDNPNGFVNQDQTLSDRETLQVKQQYAGRFPAPRSHYMENLCYTGPVESGRYVNIGMVTFNRLEFTKQAIDAVLRFTNCPYVLTVVDNCSQDGTQDYLKELKRRGVIKNLVLLTENIGVARASNLAWQQEPQAGYYLKLDNDIVVQKPGWLNRMVETVDAVPELAALAYNFEPVSYPLETVHGCRIRPKRDANLGGACYLIPKRAHEALGYWCEDYGLYGEEDHDHSVRLRLAGFLNAYMEDEDIGFHLPSGKAGSIDPVSHHTDDAREQQLHFNYRAWKDQLRHQLTASGGIFERNHSAYVQRMRSLYMPKGVFLGKIGGDIQVFDQQESLSFLTLSGRMEPGHRTQILRWLQSESFTASAVEIVCENGKDLLQVRKKRKEQNSQQRAIQLCQEGERLFKDGNYEQALAQFDHALRVEKNILGVEHARAVCLERLKRYAEAEAALASELKLQPEHADALELLKNVKHYQRIQRANGQNRKTHAPCIRVAVLSFDQIYTNCAGLRLLEPLLRLPEIELSWAVHVVNRRGMFDTEAIKNADLLVIQRMLPSLGAKEALSGVFKMGVPVIYEVDDLLMEMPPANPHRDFAMQCLPFILDVMRRAVALTVSTETLKAELLQWNPNIYVLPNLIDERLWTQAQRPHAGPVVIGFTGTSTHGEDLRMIEEAFVQISAKHGPGVAFQFMGCVTDRLARLPGARMAEFTPDYQSFARALQATPMDVAVVSLEDNRFNRCKSNIKWLEYSACGIAGVYSDLPPYNSCIRHGQTGLLVGTRLQDWFQAIDTLVTNTSLRRAMAQQARQEVLSEYTLASPRVQLYADAYHAVLGRPRQDKTVSSAVQFSAQQAVPRSQIRGVDLGTAVALEPHLQGVVERVNRALSLGRTQMAVRMVQKKLGHRAEAAKILALLEEPQLTAVL
jgi:GT2 family glycosyltransferase